MVTGTSTACTKEDVPDRSYACAANVRSTIESFRRRGGAGFRGEELLRKSA